MPFSRIKIFCLDEYTIFDFRILKFKVLVNLDEKALNNF